ncbi:hypothetical protein BC939DRAFT_449363 [Gamsiella multidivaricata]|uniref:uncharacterized protein n=1 Tax=Gamsiella multidivaricata TaxID=101098 RepID=UPI00221F22BE|nr:uncharacterized protein BC939DRAFT_449363 [Gamsiella multidivaricata]KAG0365756.1 hypothetical protein BGZ54_006244 [Gamsiella multidivaricata]KAI7824840.1 hypothetical protein BC939DRAFT_449363 [Gamsiella multidivaricata]
MDASELNSYREEVATIDAALLSDPQNQELLALKTELLELISLTESLLQQEEAAASTPTAGAVQESISLSVSAPSPHSASVSASGSGYSTPTATQRISTATSSSQLDPSKQPIYQPPPSTPHRSWAVGDKCRALFAADGKFYEATILTIGGGGQAFSVQYKGYESSPPGVVGPQDLKPPHDPKKYQKQNHASPGVGDEVATTSEQKKRGADDGPAATGATGAHAGGAGKKKQKGQPSEQVQKQMAWQNFAKGGGAKKSKGTTPLLKKSIFASPEGPDGKVGVVGSGKGMTHFQQRGKHVYGQRPDSSAN